MWGPAVDLIAWTGSLPGILNHNEDNKYYQRRDPTKNQIKQINLNNIIQKTNTTSLFSHPRAEQLENLSQALYSSCSKSDKKEKVKLISKREKTKREEGKNEIKYH